MSKTESLKLEDMSLSTGKKARLYRLLYTYGPGNGKMVVLPIDQGLEHGPRDFFDNPESVDPEYQLRIASEGGYSAIAFQIGLAEKYIAKYAGKVPLILKINGKTEVPPDEASFSPLTASVQDAVRLGADAVGYTCYVGSSAQDRDFRQFSEVRQEAEKYGMPTIMWAYPRGKYIEEKGGKESLWAIDYAARVACELGADVVKVNIPKANPEKDAKAPKPYNTLHLNMEEAVRKVVRSAGKTMVLISGGSKIGDAELLDQVKAVFRAGVTGLIFGRNIWQRKFEDAMSMTKKIREVIATETGVPAKKQNLSSALV